MGRRRTGREAAVQFLYSRDLGGATTSAEDVDAFWSLHEAGAEARPFADALVAGALLHLQDIDSRLAAAAENFRLERFSPTDRNILRVAVYEMLYEPDTPPVVAINEAIEIAKRFGGTDSARFVNGVLDRVLRSAGPAGGAGEAPARPPTAAPDTGRGPASPAGGPGTPPSP